MTDQFTASSVAPTQTATTSDLTQGLDGLEVTPEQLQTVAVLTNAFEDMADEATQYAADVDQVLKDEEAEKAADAAKKPASSL